MSGTDDCGNISSDFFGELSVLFRCQGVVAVVWMSWRRVDRECQNIISSMSRDSLFVVKTND